MKKVIALIALAALASTCFSQVIDKPLEEKNLVRKLVADAWINLAYVSDMIRPGGLAMPEPSSLASDRGPMSGYDNGKRSLGNLVEITWILNDKPGIVCGQFQKPRTIFMDGGCAVVSDSNFAGACTIVTKQESTHEILGSLYFACQNWSK